MLCELCLITSAECHRFVIHWVISLLVQSRFNIPEGAMQGITMGNQMIRQCCHFTMSAKELTLPLVVAPIQLSKRLGVSSSVVLVVLRTGVVRVHLLAASMHVAIIEFLEESVMLHQLGSVLQSHAKTILLPLPLRILRNKHLIKSFDVLVVRLPLAQKPVCRLRVLRWLGTPAFCSVALRCILGGRCRRRM